MQHNMLIHSHGFYSTNKFAHKEKERTRVKLEMNMKIFSMLAHLLIRISNHREKNIGFLDTISVVYFNTMAKKKTIFVFLRF